MDDIHKIDNCIGRILHMKTCVRFWSETLENHYPEPMGNGESPFGATGTTCLIHHSGAHTWSQGEKASNGGQQLISHSPVQKDAVTQFSADCSSSIVPVKLF
jgi:hypothetical protein